MNKADGPYRYVIISKTKDESGFPQYNRHTLTESAQTEEAALLYAERRAKSGYWVDVYKELYYHTGKEL